MTKVMIRMTGKRIEMLFSGHAGKGRNEEVNLCCAGVSMLSGTALECAFRFMEEKKGREFSYNSSPGFMCMSLECNDEYMAELQMYHDFIRAGIDLLIQKYPGRIIWGE